MLATIPFGRTGHESTRAIFGAASLSAVSRREADQVLDLLLEHGVNHIDTAASYADSELRIASWLKRVPDTFFLATKTDEREYGPAKAELHRSLDRLGGVDHVDLIQLHNLVDVIEWESALREGGALEAAIEARDEGLARFVGVTGHGLSVPAMHDGVSTDSRSIQCCCRTTSCRCRTCYASEFENLAQTCSERGVAIQTIKSIALAPWDGRTQTAATWYEPLRDPHDIELAVDWVLGREGLFLNTVGDVDLLPAVLSVAERSDSLPDETAMRELVERNALAPLFP
jgi:aryl-alcohol dehydrogenase-like predicted oxidoreductase